MELEKIKIIDFRKMQFKTFLARCEKQYLEKINKNFSGEQKKSLRMLFDVLQMENNIPIQINYFYLEYISKPLDRFTMLSHFQDYDEFLFENKSCFDMAEKLNEEEFEKLYDEELEKLNKKVFSALDILEIIDISDFDKKYETEFAVDKYFYDQLMEKYRMNN